MARKMLRVAAVLMSIMMMLALAACQSAAPVTTSAPASATAAATVAPTPVPTEAPPVTLKYWSAYGATGTSGIHTDAIMNELTKRTGVIVDLVFNQTQEQFNAQLASGDLPDALTCWITDTKVLVEGGNVIDMEPLLADHGKDIEKGKVLFGKDFISDGQNKLYLLPIQGCGLDTQPSKTFDAGTGIGAYVRWDAYKKIGYPEWTGGLNDLIPILKQMQDATPATADGKKVYALSPWLADWGLWNVTVYPEGINNIFAEAAGLVDINPATYEITSLIGNTNSSLWQGAKFFNKAWQAGIMDPDSLAEKFDQAMEKENSGRVLMGPTNWAVSGANGAMAKNGLPDQGYMALKVPSTITQVCNMFKNPFTSRFAMAITSKCKYPEKAMDLINFCNSEAGMSLFLNGVEGVNWNVGSDGVPHLTADTLALVTKGSADDQAAAGFNIYSHLWGYMNEWDSKYNCPASFSSNEDVSQQMANATPYEKDFTQHYNVAYPDQLFEKTLPDQGKVYDGSFMQMIDPATPDIKQITDNVTNYLVTAIIKAIASMSDAEFDAAQAKIIADCKNMGYETEFNWYKAQYEKAIGNQQAFYTSLK